MINTFMNESLTEMECIHLNTAYNRFIDQVQRISKRENLSQLDALHTLARIRERLARLQELCNNRYSIQYLLLKSALSLIGFEKKMNLSPTEISRYQGSTVQTSAFAPQDFEAIYEF